MAIAFLQEDREGDAAVLDALDAASANGVGLDEADVATVGFSCTLWVAARNASQIRCGQSEPAKKAPAVTAIRY